MTSIKEILKALYPIVQEANDKKNKKQISLLDRRIIALSEKLHNAKGRRGSCNIDDFEAINTPLSRLLTLSDYQVALECCPEAANHIVTYLQIQQNFDKFDGQFTALDRIKTVSEQILRHVSLYDVQLSGTVIEFKKSPLWLALASDEEFLNMPIRNLEEINQLYGDVIFAKKQDIETRNQNIASEDKIEEILSSQELTIARVCKLSSAALNVMANKLCPMACRLISGKQIQGLDLTCFTPKQLDEMIAGDGSDETIRDRLKKLDGYQVAVFLKKSSGCHFSKFDDSFYKLLPFSSLTPEQIKVLFDDQFGVNKSSVMHRLQLIQPQEIAKGFHLLSGKLARMLADSQLMSLDYSSMNGDQLDELFAFHHFLDKKECKRRIQLIPGKYVTDVAKVNSSLLEYFSPSQLKMLDTAQLNEKAVRILFPGFTLATIHPNFEYKLRESGHNGTRHEFSKGEYVRKYSKTELDEKLEQNKTRCMKMAKNFSPEQLEAMKPYLCFQHGL